MDELKVMLDNLPIGIMKSDIENFITDWIPDITIDSINLKSHSNARSGVNNSNKFAFVTFSNKEECKEVLSYFKNNFNPGGFPIEDGFGNYSIGIVKAVYREFISKKNIKNEFNNDIEDDDSASWVSGRDLPFSSKPQPTPTSTLSEQQIKKIKLSNIPKDTTEAEVENLLKTLMPRSIIVSFDLVPMKKNKKTINFKAFILLEDTSQYEPFLHHFNTNYGDGYCFVNNLGFNGLIMATIYTVKCTTNNTNSAYHKQKQQHRPTETKTGFPFTNFKNKKYTILEFHLILKKVPVGTQPDEISDILKRWCNDVCILDIKLREWFWFVKLNSWEQCDRIVSIFREQYEPHKGYAFQNKKGLFNLVQASRNEDYFRYTRGLDQELSSHLLNSGMSKVDLNFPKRRFEGEGLPSSGNQEKGSQGILPYRSCSSVSSSQESSSFVDNHQSSLYQPPPSPINTSRCPKDSPGQPPPSPINTTGCSKDTSGLDENVINELNSLLEEQQTFLQFKIKTTAFVKVFEDTLKEKCPDLFIRESDIVSIQKQANELETKRNALVAMRDQSIVEFEDLKQQLECLTLCDD